MTNAIHTFNFPTKIHAGPGARHRLVDALKGAGAKRPLIVTDRLLADLQPVQAVRELLEAAGLPPGVYPGIEGNPVISQVSGGVQAYHAGQHDSIVALGGGAPLDVAKCVALMVHHPGELLDYEDGKPDARPVDQPIPFVVAIPTTAGTGSEVGRSAVVSEDDTKIKRIIFDPRLLPPLVLADAELTLELPAKVTAATGMDALTHLVEAYLAKGYHPMCDGIALQGIRMVAQALPEAVAFAQDRGHGSAQEHLRVRQTMLDAALMGAVAFQKGLGVTHSCAHALSTVVDLHHGLANGILIPFCMSFNLAAVPERFADMAEAARLPHASAEAFIHWLNDLRARVGIPPYLKDVNVKSEHVERLVDLALADGCHGNNPRVVTRDDFHAIFTQAIG